MAEIDLPQREIAQEGTAEIRPWNPLLGLFALWIGLGWAVLRMMTIMVPLVAIAMAPVLLAYVIWGDAGSSIAYAIIGVVALPFWIIPAFEFFFPAYFDIVRLAGVFLQRVARLRPQDTLGAVNHRWYNMHRNGSRWWRCWRARP